MEGLVKECSCGSLNFERVVVKRPQGAAYTTDFVACAECRAMYFDPLFIEPRPESDWTERHRRVVRGGREGGEF